MRLMSQKQKGSIIAFTVILLSILLTSSLSIITVAVLEKKSGMATQKSVVAFQAADSGTERVLKRIYRNNSPSISSTPLNGTMPDATIATLVTRLDDVTSPTCDSARSQIRAVSREDPNYTFEVTFYESVDIGGGTYVDQKIGCTDTAWRDKVIRIQTEGFYRQTSRILDLGIKPRPLCDASDTVDDADGNTYGLLPIGDQCWLDRNMQVGTRIGSSTAQTDNGTMEYYCFNNIPSNCTTNNTNKPDGGLYNWDEAMQYETDERSQGICPDGFHVPSDEEWYILENAIDGTIDDIDDPNPRGINAGTKIQPGGTSGFEGNRAGFGNPGAATFSDRTGSGRYWSSTETAAAYASFRFWVIGNPSTYRGTILKDNEFSVRCVMD